MTGNHHDGPVGRLFEDRGLWHLLSTARVPIPNTLCGLYPKRPWARIQQRKSPHGTDCQACKEALARC